MGRQQSSQLNCYNCDFYEKLDPETTGFHNRCALLDIWNMSGASLRQGCHYHSHNTPFWEQLEQEILAAERRQGYESTRVALV